MTSDPAMADSFNMIIHQATGMLIVAALVLLLIVWLSPEVKPKKKTRLEVWKEKSDPQQPPAKLPFWKRWFPK